MPGSQDCPDEQPRIIVIGYGPVGKMVAAKIRENDYRPVIVDLNMDTVAALQAEKTKLANERDILRQAAKYFAGETNW